MWNNWKKLTISRQFKHTVSWWPESTVSVTMLISAPSILNKFFRVKKISHRSTAEKKSRSFFSLFCCRQNRNKNIFLMRKIKTRFFEFHCRFVWLFVFVCYFIYLISLYFLLIFFQSFRFTLLSFLISADVGWCTRRPTKKKRRDNLFFSYLTGLDFIVIFLLLLFDWLLFVLSFNLSIFAWTIFS